MTEKLDKTTTNELKDAESQLQGETLWMNGAPDVAAKFLANLDPSVHAEPLTPEEARKLLWKIDLIIVPILAFSVIIAAVDKVIISNAAIYGLIKDNHIKGNDFSWVGSILYFGFLISEWPANMLIQKLPIRTFYGITVFCWAVLTFMTATTHNFGGLMAVRFLSKLQFTRLK